MKIKNIILLCLLVSVAIFHNKLSYAGYDQGSSRTFSDTTGSATASQLPLISGMLGSATVSQLPGSYGSLTVTNLNSTQIDFPGTTTLYAGGTRTTPLLYVRKSTVASDMNSNVLLYVPADAGGSSTTFTDYSTFGATLTVTGDAVSSSAYKKFGNGSYYGTNGSVTISTAPGRHNIFGTDTCYMGAFIKMDSINTNMPIFSVGGGNTYFYYSGGGNNGLAFQIAGGVNVWQGTTTGWSAGTEYHVALRKLASNGYQLLRDGVVIASGTDSTNWDLSGNPLRIGDNGNVQWKGYIDDFYWEKNTTGTDVVPTKAKVVETYFKYALHYIPVGTDTSFLTIQDDGTYSVTTQMIVGSTTVSATTTTNIKLEVSGKLLANAFLSPSEERKKVVYSEETKANYLDELKNLRVSEWSWKENDINRLDAEAKAKADYINSKKQSWMDTNKVNYSNTVATVGTGTVTQIDTTKMNKDYKTYIELEWASLPEQTDLINDVKNKLEAGKNKERYLTPFAGDPTTPTIMQDGKETLVLNSQIGWNIKVSKNLYALAVMQQKEIESLTVLVGSLTARLNAANIP